GAQARRRRVGDHQKRPTGSLLQAHERRARTLPRRIRTARRSLRRARHDPRSKEDLTMPFDLRPGVRRLFRLPSRGVDSVHRDIGLGATTAIYSAVNVMLLRPLPFPRPNELMKLSLTTPPNGNRNGRDNMVWSFPKFVFFRDAQQDFSELALYSAGQFAITSG